MTDGSYSWPASAAGICAKPPVGPLTYSLLVGQHEVDLDELAELLDGPGALRVAGGGQVALGLLHGQIGQLAVHGRG